MAENTVDEEIAELELEKKRLKDILIEQERLRETEEGGNGSRFKAVYNNTEVHNRLEKVKIRLSVLYGFKKVGDYL